MKLTTHMLIEKGTPSGLDVASLAICEQIRTIDRHRPGPDFTARRSDRHHSWTEAPLNRWLIGAGRFRRSGMRVEPHLKFCCP